MKVILFTHKIDIDGLGCAILAKLAFNKLTIVYCDTFEVNQQIEKFIYNKTIYNYDKIFVTDICIKQPLIETLSNDKFLSNKIQILDHHKSEIEEGNGNYPFSKIIVQDENGKCCGTSLFYHYLVENHYLKTNNEIENLVELTRQYDTWEWKTIYNNEKSNELNTIFNILGRDKYVEFVSNKLLNNSPIFSEEILKEIESFKVLTTKKVNFYLNKLTVVNHNDMTIGVIRDVEDQFRNDIAETLRNNNTFNIDFVAMIVVDRPVVSMRAVKENFDVGAFALSCGGKGHKEAAGCPQNKKIMTILKCEDII